ncbi:S41 family peptidase [Flavivirga spongiicola]|uniref:S41 family peptidase n=1 Tax=Flavivirga spongiicola TaxID=421621 RepID=A0ABU7XTD6_9FLAO|nr:S41 family peptidase [Flavivirga sp. MEBiC05379]MDO5978767.1 S41 family peptidase [Flavivirga sp. MEBiC05379]
MKKLLFLFSFIFISNISLAQNSTNLDFEIVENEKAKNWKEMGQGQYKVHFDQNIKQHGETSASIESIGETVNFKALGYHIPADFGGKKIKLTGFIKTENIVNGWAGLWMRIDPQVAFDNMKSRGIKGTTDWKKYEVELNLSNQAETVVIGGLLVGSGKMWVDNLEVTIDGFPLDKAPQKKLTKAQKDKEFDQGSLITFSNLDNNQIQNLDLLGRIWGFLKYYHPEVGKGNYNWDYELFRILPKYKDSKTNLDRDNILSNWIEGLGEVIVCKSCKETSEDAILKPDLDWIKNSNMSTALKDKLQYIRKNRHQGNHYYIEMTPNVGNPIFKNEGSYKDMPYKDTGFRLLALYRYWNMIQYFFPNRHLIDKDWNTCLTEYIPQFINVKNDLEYELAFLKIIADIKDTHANLSGGKYKIQEQRGKFYPPMHVRFIENKLVVDAYFNEETKASIGLEVGDIITHINGKPVSKIVENIHDFYPASNQPTRLRDISFDILRSTNNTLDISVKRDGKVFDKTLKLFEQKEIEGYYRWYKREKNGSSFKMLDNNIGYITLKNIKKEDVKVIRKDFKDTKGIIVDIRNYPSAFMPFTLGSFFTSKYAPFVKFTNGSVNNPGAFTYGKDLSIPPKEKFYKGKVVVLVNEISQSQAEYTAMAFRAGDNVTLVGSTTAGADGNVSRISLPGGLMTMISGIGVYYPDGTETQRIGIVPDIEVLPTVKGIKEGRDEILEKAIEIINKD